MRAPHLTYRGVFSSAQKYDVTPEDHAVETWKKKTDKNPLPLNTDAKQHIEYSKIRKLNLISIGVKSIYHVRVQFEQNYQCTAERY